MGDIDSADGARGREKTRSLITISEGDTRTEIRRETEEDDTHTARQPGAKWRVNWSENVDTFK